MQLLHIAPDDKFIDRAIRFFEKDSRITNKLLILSNEPDNVYVKTKENHRLRKDAEDDIVRFIDSYDAVVLHSFPNYIIGAINRCKNTNIAWLGWGYDYYDIIYPSKYIAMMEDTRDFYIDRISPLPKSEINEQISKAVPNPDKVMAIGKIKLFCPVIETEYAILSQVVKKMPLYHSWNYVSELENDLCEGMSSKQTNTVIVGNSADPSNNHVDVLRIIKRVVCDSGVKVITPLSYGNMKYAGEVESDFSAALGELYIPLRNFMVIEDYVRLLLQAKICIMAHKRQQALGNLIMMLKLGYKIYMHDESPLFSHLVNNGVRLFSLKDIALHGEELTHELSVDEQVMNKNIISELYCSKRNIQKTKELVDKMLV